MKIEFQPFIKIYFFSGFTRGWTYVIWKSAVFYNHVYHHLQVLNSAHHTCLSVRVKLISVYVHTVCCLGLLTFGVISFTYANQFLRVELLGDCKQNVNSVFWCKDLCFWYIFLELVSVLYYLSGMWIL